MRSTSCWLQVSASHAPPCPLAKLRLLLTALAVQIISTSGTSSSPCLIGDRGEVRVPLGNFSRNSVCCESAEVFLARRTHGYCPDMASWRRLPFSVRCSFDESLGPAYVPDEESATAAAHVMCSLAGCQEAAAELTADFPQLGAAPQCVVVDYGAEGVSAWSAVARVVLGIAIATCMSAMVAIVHFKITPLWLERTAKLAKASPVASAASSTRDAAATSAAAMPAGVGAAGASGEGGDTTSPAVTPALGADVGGELPKSLLGVSMAGVAMGHAPPGAADGKVSSLHKAPDFWTTSGEGHPARPPTALPLVLGTPAGPDQQQELIAAAAPGTAASPEAGLLPGASASALQRLADARVRCHAHFKLFRGMALCSIACRTVVAVVVGSHVRGTATLVILLAAAWQLAALTLLWRSLPVFNAGDQGCVALLRDLRAWAAAGFFCELVVVCLAGGAFASEGYQMHGEGQRSVWRFVLEELSLSFVLVRLYVSWLAYFLHRWRVHLSLTVLPECDLDYGWQLPRAPAWQSGSAAANKRTCKLSPNGQWEIRPLRENDDKKRPLRRSLAISAAVFGMVVFIGAAVTLTRWHTASNVEEEHVSSCRTAMRGVDFCVPMNYLGNFRVVGSAGECCGLCDTEQDCDAWVFAEGDLRGGGNCWRMSFLEEPCSEHPGHMQCRCHSHGRIGGYRPSEGDSIWSGDT